MATTSLEREVKLTSENEIPVERLGGPQLETRFFTSTYHDTPELLLAKCGITLRRRLERGTNAWQLKLPVDAGRQEIEALGPPAHPPAEIADLLFAVTGRYELVPVATLQTRRSGVRFENGSGTAEVVFDAVAVMEGQRVATSFTEIEVELTSGDATVLKAAEKRLRKLGAKRSDGRTKLARALGLAPTAARRFDSDEEQLRSFFAEQYHAILAADPGVRLGEDPEAVHKLRVAVRRLRAVLRTAQPFLVAEWVDGLRDELAWLGGALGPLRDDDVMLERLRTDATGLPDEDCEALAKVISLVETERESARVAALAALTDDRYLGLLGTLETATRELPLLDMTLRLDTLALKELRRLEKVLALLDDDSSDEAMHAARIRGKRARYAAELAGPARGKRAQTLIARLKDLQDVLGDHNDGVVAEGRLRRLAATARAPRAAFTAGRLAERRRTLADEARRNLPRARRRLARAGRKAWS